jgi:hypothetical protein
MKLFGRRRSEPPEWAEFLDADEWEAFSSLVRDEAEGRGWSHDFEAGFLEQANGGGRMGLGNLAQTCHLAPRAEWGDLVRQHFERLLANVDEPQFGDREEALAAIKARLLPDSFVAELGFEVAARRVGTDLQLALAYDLPYTVDVPDREKILAWGAEDELFELAVEHARAEPGLELDRHVIGEDIGMWSLVGDSFFTATHALWADDFDPPASEHGTLVAVPHRHAVLAHPIRDLSVVGAVTHMVLLVQRMYVEGPGSLSDGLYWLRAGTLERLDVRVDGESTTFTPSQELLEIFNRLE